MGHHTDAITLIYGHHDTAVCTSMLNVIAASDNVRDPGENYAEAAAHDHCSAAKHKGPKSVVRVECKQGQK